jgi:PAS domain S-box-containing protein/putative nucleotidyltransferase with HDIG domain
MLMEERRDDTASPEVAGDRYIDILDAIQDGYFEVDLSGNYTMVNRVVCRDLGYAREELIGLSYKVTSPKEDIPRIFRIFHEVYRTGEPNKGYDFQITRKDGTVIDTETSVSLLRNERGEPVGFRGISRDVTERKRAENALKESDQRYRAFIANSSEGIWRLELDQPISTSLSEAEQMRQMISKGYVAECNDAIARMYGLEKAENFTGTRMSKFTSLDDPLDRQILSSFIRSGYSLVDVESRTLDRQGKDRWFSNYLTGVLDNGVLVRGWGVRRDITERKQVEENLAKSYGALRRTLDGSIKSIAKMVEMKDPYTAGHQQRVAELASAMAGEMGLSIEQVKYIYLAGLIHDIGKFYVPADILSKPGKLTQIEMAMIRTHAQGSYDILSEIEFPWPLAQIAWQHHERLDGSGYPQGLSGDDILPEAKILAVSDVVEAMASYRPYRPALGIDRALEEIELNRGILYGTEAADVCLKLFREKGFTFTAGV